MTVHAMCEDYRANASIDLEHDAADLGRKIACQPTFVGWSDGPASGSYYPAAAFSADAVVTSGFA